MREINGGNKSVAVDLPTILSHASYERIEEEQTCIWRQDADGNWQTDCENSFVLIGGTPSENGMRYCPYCGKRLKEEGEC